VIDLNSTADFNEFCRSAELFCLQPLCTGSDTQWITVDTVDFCIQSRNIRDLFERFYTPNNMYLSRELNHVSLVDSLNLPHCITSAGLKPPTLSLPLSLEEDFLRVVICISREISFWGKSVFRIRNTVIDLNSTACSAGLQNAILRY
jgi:hypothetical protein